MEIKTFELKTLKHLCADDRFIFPPSNLELLGPQNFSSGLKKISELRWFRWYENLSTALSIPLAVVLLVLLSPLFLLVALATKLADGGPIFYRQVRVGRDGAKFKLSKFRTMRVDAEAGGARWAIKGDPRITPLGHFLRASHIDELPQLWNVVCGQMAFVGPRPERPEYYRLLEERVPYFHLRNLMKPGITGWAQIKFGYVSSVEDSQKKLEYDLFYFLHRSPLLDLKIACVTFPKFFPKNYLSAFARAK